MFGKTAAVLAGLAIGQAIAWPTAANAGDTVALDIAAGRACWVEAYTNSAAVWKFAILDGTTIVAGFQGRGANFSPMQLVKGSARFNVGSGLIVKFASATGTANVKLASATIQGEAGDASIIANLIGGEDGVDDDWQDVIVNVTCLRHAG